MRSFFLGRERMASRRPRKRKAPTKPDAPLNLKPTPGLIFGDAVESMKNMVDGSVQLILADPPTAYTTAWLDEAKRVLRPDGSLFIFRYTLDIDLINEVKLLFNLEDEFVWTFNESIKTFHAPRTHAYVLWFSHGKPKVMGRFKSSVFSDYRPFPQDGSYDKSPSVIRSIINNTTERGDIVVDPFVGFGTSLEVSQELGRFSVGIEFQKKFFYRAYNRLWSTSEDEAIS
jgi:DNA modification methylase